MNNINIPKSDYPLSTKDFESNQMVKWCPGCGDHAILKAVEKVFPQLSYKKENYAVISGIGCSSRFPYYMNTYGIHGIHGRAAAIATGVKLANPALSVWVISGDGDSMAIGGNHFIHFIRRNINLNLLLFNNQIYGLTKGQYSPTTVKGKVTKTSPYGTIEEPFCPGKLAIGAGATFFARGLDNNIKLLTDIMIKSDEHEGASVTEILQNCVIFNDNTHRSITSRETRNDAQLILEHGKPMLFGKEKKKGLILNKKNDIEVAVIGEKGITEEDILVHDASTKDSTLHYKLVQLAPPAFPAVFGVIRDVKEDVYDEKFEEQINEQKEISNIQSVDDLLNSGEVWEF